jgi:flagellar assembly protein FliH
MQTDAEWKAFDAIAEEARRRPARVERMTYRAAGTSSVSARAEGDSAADGSRGVEAGTAETARFAQLEERLRVAEQAAKADVEAARREGLAALERSRQQAEQAAAAAKKAVEREIGSAIESFLAERNDYFAKAEQEVVKLALAIAARILNREASLDPLLLAGAVRVALGQLGETTGVRLRCPNDQVERWREQVRQWPNLPAAPEVAADAALGAGECRIEARIGSVDLGVRAQLEEIERGFFDLLDQRPGGALRRSENPGRSEAGS